jgi:hypothetical protein
VGTVSELVSQQLLTVRSGNDRSCVVLFSTDLPIVTHHSAEVFGCTIMRAVVRCWAKTNGPSTEIDTSISLAATR